MCETAHTCVRDARPPATLAHHLSLTTNGLLTPCPSRRPETSGRAPQGVVTEICNTVNPEEPMLPSRWAS